PRPHQVRDDLARAGRGRLRRVGEQHQVRAVLARLDQRRGPLHVQRHRVGDRDDPGGDRHARLQQPTQRDRGGGDRGGGRGGAVLRTTVLYTAVLRGGRRGRLAEGGEVRGGLGHRVAGPALGGGLLGGGSLLAGGFLLSGFGRCAVLFFCRRFRAAGRGAGPQRVAEHRVDVDGALRGGTGHREPHAAVRGGLRQAGQHLPERLGRGGAVPQHSDPAHDRGDRGRGG